MKVSVIIPFRNKHPILEECIESVKKQSHKNIEIILVSDREKVKDRDIISLVNPRCRGVGDKRNLGAKKAHGNILFFLDSDCVLKNDSISKLVKIFKTYETDAVSGKPLAPRKANLLGIVTGFEYEDRFNQMGECYVDVAATTCLGVLRKAFQRVGGFKDYSKGEATGEDWDFSVKLRQKNYKIYHTNTVEVFHEHRSETLGCWFKRRVQHAKYRVVHYKKYKKATDQYSSWLMLISMTFLFSLPIVIRMYRRTRNPKLFLLPFIAFLRNVAWIGGVILGLVEK